jgi:hypothetical protein
VTLTSMQAMSARSIALLKRLNYGTLSTDDQATLRSAIRELRGVEHAAATARGDFGRALSDEARMAIVQRLFRDGEER